MTTPQAIIIAAMAPFAALGTYVLYLAVRDRIDVWRVSRRVETRLNAWRGTGL